MKFKYRGKIGRRFCENLNFLKPVFTEIEILNYYLKSLLFTASINSNHWYNI